MDLSYVVPKAKESFGILSFGVEVDARSVRGKSISRTYELWSTRQRCDNFQVTIPYSAGDKSLTFKTDEPVRLINPKLTITGYQIDGNGYVDYVCTADDIIRV